MAVITISRQLGSLGDEVALALQRRLNYQIINREIINQAAIRANKPEMALAMIDELGLLGLHPDLKSRQAYHDAVHEIIEETANRGEAIIIGRAGQVVLRKHPDVFHVKIFAPTSIRSRRISELQGISMDSALAQINASDKSRESYMKRNYSVTWNDPELYDLIINTARIDPEQAASLICEALGHSKAKNSQASRDA